MNAPDHLALTDMFREMYQHPGRVEFLAVQELLNGSIGSQYHNAQLDCAGMIRDRLSVNRVTGMRTILVVEDYDDVRQMLKVLLESEEFRVLEAASGSEALEVVEDHRPDGILMDLALPGFDGFETMRRIRSIDGFQNTPIVVLTAFTGPSTYETALRAGSNYFMAKPIDFDELAALLKQILFDGNTPPKYTRAPSQRAVLTTKPPVQHQGRQLTYSV